MKKQDRFYHRLGKLSSIPGLGVTPKPKDLLDMTAPPVVKLNADRAIVGGVYRTFLALLRHLGEKSGVNLTIYTRQVTAAEEKQIINNASNKDRMALNSSNDLRRERRDG